MIELGSRPAVPIGADYGTLSFNSPSQFTTTCKRLVCPGSFFAIRKRPSGAIPASENSPNRNTVSSRTTMNRPPVVVYVTATSSSPRR